MVCIAAFIILALAGIIVAFVSIFRPKIGKRYLKILKKSWSCFGKRVTLQKCETGFGDDVKNSILGRVAVSRPKMVKPLSAGIEIVSILIVLITVWSLVEGVKAGMALWTLGTCNVKHASACSLGAEVCSIDDNTQPDNLVERVGLWFSDWGEIFSAIPDKFRDWSVDNFKFDGISKTSEAQQYDVIDIFDPGCEVCLVSFRAQLDSGFFDTHNVQLVPFPIQDSVGKFKYPNSNIIARYMLASYRYGEPRDAASQSDTVAFQIIKRIYTAKNTDGINWQSVLNDDYSAEQTEATLLQWLKDFGYHSDERAAIKNLAMSTEITEIIQHNNEIVTNNIHAKGIPTMIYDGRKHTGKFETE